MQTGWNFMKAPEERKTWQAADGAEALALSLQRRDARSLGKLLLVWLGCGLLVFEVGCAGQRPWVDQALMAEPTPLATLNSTAAEYLISCPDQIQIKVSERPELSGTQEVAGDGRINGTGGERVRVEGLSTTEAARRFASTCQLNPDQVSITVAAYRSQKLYLIGQVAGEQRTVPYQGPETVLEVLQRVGGVTPGAAPDEVYVVRSRIAEGKQPEVFHVRLREILVQHNDGSNVRLQPQDQIYVGETSRSIFSRYLPPWLRPMFDTLWGMARSSKPELPRS
jgi:protein involved in polysaccharide export with SLBB domain